MKLKKETKKMKVYRKTYLVSYWHLDKTRTIIGFGCCDLVVTRSKPVMYLAAKDINNFASEIKEKFGYDTVVILNFIEIENGSS